MSETKTRRSVALLDGSKDDLEVIKSKIGVSTDNAAINDAVKFRAKVLEACSDIGSVEEMLTALSIYGQIKSEMKSNGSLLFLENPKNPNAKVRVLVP